MIEENTGDCEARMDRHIWLCGGGKWGVAGERSSVLPDAFHIQSINHI